MSNKPSNAKPLPGKKVVNKEGRLVPWSHKEDPSLHVNPEDKKCSKRIERRRKAKQSRRLNYRRNRMKKKNMKLK